MTESKKCNGCGYKWENTSDFAFYDPEECPECGFPFNQDQKEIDNFF